MNKSLFAVWVSMLWPQLALYIKEKEHPKDRTYLFKEMLNTVYSADQKWEGFSASTTYVAADVVSMDSPLPLKMRSAIATSNGRIPKIGMKKVLRESELKELQIMEDHVKTTNNGEEKDRILQKIANDGDACSIGIDERIEDIFLIALSNGVVAIENDENAGTAIRLEYKYYADHQFGVLTEGYVEREDIEKVFDKAEEDGNSITKVMLSKAQCNSIRKMQWARELVADAQGKVYDSNSKLPVPSQKAFEDAFEGEWGATLQTVNRSIIKELNGVRTAEKAWNNNVLVFLCNNVVGSLVWSTLAEADHPVEGVNYTTVDQYKLISRYSIEDPALQEVTKGQALVCPVIEDVDQIYTLDVSVSSTGDATAEAEDTEDVYVTIDGVKYNKADVAAQLTALGVPAEATDSDDDIINKVNTLSQAKKTKLFAALTAVTD
ncbi:MAG: hypothetical protein LUC22_03040 [Prevotella sp.]|nr:hypothetical protein [Prevotella sp.]